MWYSVHYIVRSKACYRCCCWQCQYIVIDTVSVLFIFFNKILQEKWLKGMWCLILPPQKIQKLQMSLKFLGDFSQSQHFLRWTFCEPHSLKFNVPSVYCHYKFLSLWGSMLLKPKPIAEAGSSCYTTKLTTRGQPGEAFVWTIMIFFSLSILFDGWQDSIQALINWNFYIFPWK